jgi:hypothetical protein
VHGIVNLKGWLGDGQCRGEYQAGQARSTHTSNDDTSD